jgi:hypothetical protein
MNPQADNFEQLRKLLALKKYEQPPPGYFDQLSARIINRIESVEMGRNTLWERLGFAFGSKPAFVCALGVVVCGLFCIGILSTLQGTTANAVASAPQLAFGSESALPMMSAPEEARSSVEPVISHASPFNDATPGVEKASYTPR